MQKLYDFSVDWLGLSFSIVAFLYFIFFALLMVYIFSMPKKDLDLELSDIPVIGNIFPNRNEEKEHAILGVIWGILIFIIFIVWVCKDILYFYSSYKNNDYNIVIGEVSEFVPAYKSKQVESFCIGEVQFSYSKSDSLNDYCGYHKVSGDGGVITGDGQKLKIKYIPSGSSNKIVSIEEFK